MKKVSVWMVLWAMLFTINSLFAQTANIQIKDRQIPLFIELSFYKTTNLIFPYGIKSVDKGSKDVLVQKANGVENVLQLKAGKQSFLQTNLTVITSDGQLYSFILNYAEQPSALNIRMENNIVESPIVEFTQPDDNESIVKELAEKVATRERTLLNLNMVKYNVGMRVAGIYIQDDVFYFQIQLNNKSNINYSVDQLRFFISDMARSKRTASQEVELTPLQITGNSKVINGRSNQTIVIALPKFTIPDQKILSLQMMEAQGGRHLSIRIKNKTLLKAKQL